MAVLTYAALFITFHCIHSAFGCDSTYKYSPKCKPISPLQSMDDSKFEGMWYLMAASESVPYRCAVYNVTRLGPHSYHSIVKTTYFTKTLERLSYDWNVTVACNPKGHAIVVYPGYFADVNVHRNLDLTDDGTLTSYVCYEEGDVVVEQIFVYARKKSYDKARLAQILSRNGLLNIPLRENFVDCPEEVEMDLV